MIVQKNCSHSPLSFFLPISPISFYNSNCSTHNNSRTLPHFMYCNSRSPLPFLIDLNPITHVKALPD
ncbi:hypothetical protein HanIR_Chr16g0793211 [Helianthus annuus]|nr:hypothetical protein HanIR_Chr16g0793211 [Helianthus annuus]